ncbi:MAG: hypothetical protein MUF22_06470 [Chitinispirillaceae bacterium]|jgi:Tol biopolymer transport system component|nr:hypothetical protein [Chitinispirillaceae bacterium]
MNRPSSLFIALIALLCVNVSAASWNGYSMKRYTAETPHFRIHYHDGLEHLVRPVGDKFEQLYGIYRNTYNFKLPNKTEIVLQDGDESNGLAFPNLNFIVLWTHDFDFNLRGSHNWFEDVITHEFGHIASIWNSLKYPAWIEGIQFGYFSHPNEATRTELFHFLPPDILPPWFTEGIAQYESSRNGADTWDSHRDMIMRSLVLSGKMLSWDHMQVFAGKGDDFEKTYNHGFSLVSYISEKYGFDKIVAMCSLSSGPARIDFNRVIKKVLGISGEQLYTEWKASLASRYSQQSKTIGTLHAGRKINKTGYENYWPKFSPDNKKIFFLSNSTRDYGFKNLYSFSLADTIKKGDTIKAEMAISGFYDIQPASGLISFSSQKSRKSELPPSRGGFSSLDLFIDTLPPEKERFKLFPKKTERQVTFKQGVFSAAFSPTGDKLVTAKRSFDKFYLAITDTAGKSFRIVYPDSDQFAQNIYFIYSVDWSPDGRTIAFSYFDNKTRKTGFYDTATRAVSQLSNRSWDDRDPAYSADGRHLFFSSDRTGVFNIYRYTFETNRLCRITNVLGGALAPSASPDGKKVVYAGYDSSGYGIYLLDSVTALTDTTDPGLIIPRSLLQPAVRIEPPAHQTYARIPRQFLLRPTILAEQLNTKENNVYSGSSSFKAGAVFNLMDPYSWLGMGTQLGGLFLMEPTRVFRFINFDHGLVDIGSSYDAALFGSTQLLPLTLSFDYYLRGIAGKDVYYNETEMGNQTLPYNIQLQNLDVLISHYLAGHGGGMGMGQDQIALHLITGFNRYDVTMNLDPPVFFYNVGQEYRTGAMATFMAQAIDSRMSISPRGLALKTQYNMRRLLSLNNEKPFVNDEGLLKENHDRYLYHEAIGRAMMGMKAPLFGDLHAEIKGNAIRVATQDTKFPYFYQPIAWVPGYTYYFRDTNHIQPTNEDPQHKFPADTVLVTGNAVVSGSVSYRFPLSPALIDKKFWIFYLEKIYGCINLSGGAGVTNPSRLLEFRRSDWLLSYGTELRIQATTFGYIPLAVKLRWDRGFDLPAPKGGDRFALGVGFDFDNWGLVSLPDYAMPARTK